MATSYRIINHIRADMFDRYFSASIFHNDKLLYRDLFCYLPNYEKLRRLGFAEKIMNSSYDYPKNLSSNIYFFPKQFIIDQYSQSIKLLEPFTTVEFDDMSPMEAIFLMPDLHLRTVSYEKPKPKFKRRASV